MSDIVTPTPPQIPEELQEGWKAFAEWTQAMARAGEPLPPGGVLIVNRNTVMKGCLRRLKYTVASDLGIPMDCVHIEINQGLDKSIEPTVVVNPPPDWIQSTLKTNKLPESERSKEFAQTYVQATVKRIYEAFRVDLERRLKALEHRRPDLEQPVIDLLTSEETEKSDDDNGKTQSTP